MTYYNFPTAAQDSFCQTTTNGLAAGIGLADATLRAVLELIERDVFIRGITGAYDGINRLQVTWTLQTADKANGLIWDTGKWGSKVWSY